MWDSELEGMARMGHRFIVIEQTGGFDSFDRVCETFTAWPRSLVEVALAGGGFS